MNTEQQKQEGEAKKSSSMMNKNKGLFSVIGHARGEPGVEACGAEKDEEEQHKPFVVACLGGGQLGRMMALEAPRLGIQMKFLDPLGSACPAAHVVPSHCILQGSLSNVEKIRQLAQGAQVVTVEIEHVNVNALFQLEQQQEAVNVQPSARVLSIIQDKFLQKQHFATHGIAVPPFLSTPSVQAVIDATSSLGLPLMLKTRRGGYDGRGNAVLKTNKRQDVLAALTQLLGVKLEGSDDDKELLARNDLDIYAEGWVAFDVEVAVMVVRSAAAATDDHHHTVSYPAVNAIQQDSICRVVLAPARNVSETLRHACQDLAIRAIDSLGVGASGTFGVEMFIATTTKGGEQVVLLNEVAPRPHNTGHYTQDACAVSQFENHLRGICGLPLGNTQMLVEAAAMVNILGAASSSSSNTSTMQDTLASSNLAMTSLPNAVVHWYGKDSCRPGRKMGHINITGHSHGEIDSALCQLMQAENIPLSLLPNNNSNNSNSSSSTATATRASNSSSACPVVGVIMGSQSDLPTMQEAVDVLQQFNIPYQVDIVSAHRTPDKLMAYSRSAAGRGIRVIIAGAGGAAHLPGMVAAMTPLPVIGVPVKTSTLNGVDSLYSIVQMPKGVPVATVAIGNAANAGLLAVRILATSRPHLRLEMIQYQTEMKDMVNETSARLLELGSDEYLKQMDSKSKSVNV